jgi:hypothetical protein
MFRVPKTALSLHEPWDAELIPMHDKGRLTLPPGMRGGRVQSLVGSEIWEPSVPGVHLEFPGVYGNERSYASEADRIRARNLKVLAGFRLWTPQHFEIVKEHLIRVLLDRQAPEADPERYLASKRRRSNDVRRFEDGLRSSMNFSNSMTVDPRGRLNLSKEIAEYFGNFGGCDAVWLVFDRNDLASGVWREVEVRPGNAIGCWQPPVIRLGVSYDLGRRNRG